MIGLLLWKLPEKRGRSLRVGERSILHMRFTCAEITRGPKTPAVSYTHLTLPTILQV